MELNRYDSPAGNLFTRELTLNRWMIVEITALNALKEVGVVPPVDAEDAISAAPEITAQFIEEVDAQEAAVHHDLAAFVDVLQRHTGYPGRWFHYGLTSSDVVDTALFWTISDALAHIDNDLLQLLKCVDELAQWHQGSVMVGRTHGQHAEPTTFGRKLAIHGLTLLSARDRLNKARKRCAVGKLAGPVGTHSVFPVEAERIALKDLGLRRVRGTQVIGRDRIADMVFACAQLAGLIEAIATDIRLLSQSEIQEVGEGSADGITKGSSSMPHKRNPVRAERLCGLARVVRSWVTPALENVALWNERDISHSSVERIMVPEVLGVTNYVVRSCTTLLRGLFVDDKQMGGVVKDSNAVLSHTLLSRMIVDGESRDGAYRTIQTTNIIDLDDHNRQQLMVRTLTDSESVVRTYRKRLDKESRTW